MNSASQRSLASQSQANDMSALCYVLHYELGILEGERMIYSRYFRTDEDSCASKLITLLQEISNIFVNLSKNTLVCKNTVT